MLDEHDQLAVIRGLRDGNREAWAALYDAYSASVWRYAARLVGANAADVGEVVHEVFLAAARSARQFDANRGSLWNWLAGITHHQAAALRRRRGDASRLKALIEARAAELRHLWEAADLPDELCEQKELVELVRAVLTELSADYAALLSAKYLDDQTLEAMSAQFGISVEAVKSKLARARREFRDKFERLTRDTPIIASEPRNATE